MNQIILKQIGKRGAYGVKIRPQIERKSSKILFGDRAKEYGITPESAQLILPNAVINIDDDYENLWLDYAKSLGVVVETEDEGNKSPKAFYYIHNPEKKAEDTVQMSYDKLDAQYAIKNLSEKDKGELGKILGFSTQTMTPTRITEELLLIAQTVPSKDSKRNYKTILDLINGDKNEYRFKLLFADLKFGSYIRQKNGSWYYNDVFLGTREEEVTTWLKDPLNKDIVDLFKIQLYPAQELITTGDVESKNARDKNLKSTNKV